MRARRWTLAATYQAPSDYGIPELPAWRVCRGECGELAFAAADTEPFIAADQPIKVRR